MGHKERTLHCRANRGKKWGKLAVNRYSNQAHVNAAIHPV
jgi:hypothetical protein